MIEEIFYYGIWVFPPIIILLSAYTKNLKVFCIGILSSIFISFSCYVNSEFLKLFSLKEGSLIKLNAIESHRHLVIIDIHLIGGLIIISYSLFISWLVWNYLIKKPKGLVFKNFVNESSFYFILFFASIIDIGIDIIETTYWHAMMFSFFLFLPFLYKALSIKYGLNKKLKTSKFTWILLVIIVIFYLIIWFS